MPEHVPKPASPQPVAWQTQLFLASMLLLQLALPLTYYLGDRGYDDRFAWRMSSAQQEMNQREHTRILCDELVSGEQGEMWHSVSVSGETLAVWEVAMQRRQPVIIRRYLEWRAANRPAKQTRFRIVAVIDGELVDRETWLADHQTGLVTRWEAAP